MFLLQLALVVSHAGADTFTPDWIFIPTTPVFGTTLNSAPRVVIPIGQLKVIVPVSVGVNSIVVIPSGSKYLLIPDDMTNSRAQPEALEPSTCHSIGTHATTVKRLGV